MTRSKYPGTSGVPRYWTAPDICRSLLVTNFDHFTTSSILGMMAVLKKNTPVMESHEEARGVSYCKNGESTLNEALITVKRERQVT